MRAVDLITLCVCVLIMSTQVQARAPNKSAGRDPAVSGKIQELIRSPLSFSGDGVLRLFSWRADLQLYGLASSYMPHARNDITLDTDNTFLRERRFWAGYLHRPPAYSRT